MMKTGFVMIGLVVLSTSSPDPSLRLVQVMFRHGDRTPSRTFPTDPNKENSWPQGFGQLTKLGMQQLYALGQLLRNRYDGFLNSTYIAKEVYTRSSDKDRVLMSCQVLLAGLYPPSGSQLWNPDLKWQPIPVHAAPFELDRVLNIDYDCPRYEELEKLTYESETVRQYQQENAEDLFTIAVQSGMGINTSLYDLLATIPDPLMIEKVHNKTWADWVTQHLYEKSQEMAQFRIELFGFYPDMVKIKGGRWIYEALTNMKNYSMGTMDKRQKIFLYGSHDTIMAVALNIMGVYNHIRPPFGAMFALELHEIDERYYVKISYKNDTAENAMSEPEELQIEGCPNPCSLEDFETLVTPMMFSSDEEQIAFCSQSLTPQRVEGTTILAIVIVIFGTLVITGFAVVCKRKRDKSENLTLL